MKLERFQQRRVPYWESPGLRAMLRICMALLIASLAIAPGPIWAQDASDDPYDTDEVLWRPKKQLPDRFMIRAGWAYIFEANPTIDLGLFDTGIGVSLDWAELLGGSTNTDSLRIDSRYRFTRKHSLGFSWYRLALAGQRILQQDVQLPDGSVISAGASTNSSIDLNMWRLYYNWSFYNTDKIEVGVSPGLYVANIGFSLAAQGSISSPIGGVFASSLTEESLSLPLPSIGLLANYQITKRLLSQFRTDFFYLKVDDFEGALFEFYVGLEYRIFKNFAVGAAYDRLSVDATSGDFGVRVPYNILYLYGTLYAFDTPS